MRLLFVGDPHFRNKSSIYRLDDPYVLQKDKLTQILKLGEGHQVQGIVFCGDIFHSPKEPYKLTIELYKILTTSSIPKYTLIGNHDLVGYNLDTLHESALGVLAASGALTIINEDIVWPEDKVVLRGIHYENRLTPSLYQFNKYPDYQRMIVTHNLIAPLSDAPFEFVHPADVKTDAHLVIAGHYHSPFDWTDGKTYFINPGVPVRWTITESKQTPQVLLVDCQKGTSTFIELNHKSQVKAFDITKALAQKETRQNIDNFIHQLETTEFGGANLEETILKYGVDQRINKGIIDELLRRVQTCDSE